MIALSSFPNPTPILFGQGLQSKVRLFQISTLSFCLCPHHPPGIISAWSQGQIFTSPLLFWTHSLCSWLLVFFSGSKCRRYFSFHISCPLVLCFFPFCLPSLFSPSSDLFFSLYIPHIPAVSKCSILGSFLETLSCIRLLVSFLLHSTIVFPSKRRPVFIVLVFTSPLLPLRVSLVARCAAGSPLCCWGGTWRWCCAPWI